MTFVTLLREHPRKSQNKAATLNCTIVRKENTMKKTAKPSVQIKPVVNEPLEIPGKELEALCTALNNANHAFRQYFDSCGVVFDGDMYTLNQHPAWRKVMDTAHKNEATHRHDLIRLLAHTARTVAGKA